jgi:hypothetical protein
MEFSMLSMSRSSQFLPYPACNALRVAVLAGLLSQSAPVRGYAAPTADPSPGTAELSLLNALVPGPTTDTAPWQAVPNHLSEPIPPSGVGLRRLYPEVATQGTQGRFLADIRRWTMMLYGKYQVFLPLAAMFIVMGLGALVYILRQRRPVARGRFHTGLSRQQSWLAADGGVTLAMSVARNINWPPRPRGPDRSRIKRMPVSPSTRH